MLVDYWQPAAHRDDDDRKVIEELAKIIKDENETKKKNSVQGVVDYGRRQEARVTFFAQGPAEDSTKPDYYYKDRYEEPVRNPPKHSSCTSADSLQGDGEDVPKQHKADSAVAVLNIIVNKFTEGVKDKKEKEKIKEEKEEENKCEFERKLSSSLSISEGKGGMKRSNPYPRYETIQECWEVGRSLLEAQNGYELIVGIVGALHGELTTYQYLTPIEPVRLRISQPIQPRISSSRHKPRQHHNYSSYWA